MCNSDGNQVNIPELNWCTLCMRGQPVILRRLCFFLSWGTFGFSRKCVPWPLKGIIPSRGCGRATPPVFDWAVGLKEVPRKAVVKLQSKLCLFIRTVIRIRSPGW